MTSTIQRPPMRANTEAITGTAGATGSIKTPYTVNDVVISAYVGSGHMGILFVYSGDWYVRFYDDSFTPLKNQSVTYNIVTLK